MKKLIVFLLVMGVAISGFAQKGAHHQDSTHHAVYSCPMHADINLDKPGKCSKCGMDLVAVQKDKLKAGKSYCCPMHPDAKSDKPGKCPKCGMKLAETAKEKKEAVKAYTCPMHPDITSDKPGKCSKCGMKLTEVEQKEKNKS